MYHLLNVSEKHQKSLSILKLHLENGTLLNWNMVKNAYRTQVLISHPDKGGSKEAFTQLTEAYNDIENAFKNNLGVYPDYSSYEDILSTLNKTNDDLNEVSGSFEQIHKNIHKQTKELQASIRESHTKLRAALEPNFNNMLYEAAWSFGPCFLVLTLAVITAIEAETTDNLNITFGLLAASVALLGYGALTILNKSNETPTQHSSLN